MTPLELAANAINESEQCRETCYVCEGTGCSPESWELVRQVKCAACGGSGAVEGRRYGT